MNVQRRRRFTPVLLVALAILPILLAACGAAAAPAPANPGGASGERTSVGSAGSGTDQNGSYATPGPVDQGGGTARKDDAKIIRTGSIQLQVEDVDIAVGKARQAIIGLNGYISASQAWQGDGDQPVAEITYRIPTERWEEALQALRALAIKVVSEQTDAVEVTGQLVDLEARIRNLKASETALVGIAAKAEKISDVLEVQARLTEVRGQIEQLDGQRVGLTDQVAYGTIRVAFGTEVKAVTAIAKGWDPASEVDRALATLVEAAQGVTNGAIWFVIVWVPTLLILLVVGILARLGLRRAGVGLPSLRPSPNSATGWVQPGSPPATGAAAESPTAQEPPAGS